MFHLFGKHCVVKEYNIKRHYMSKHFEKFQFQNVMQIVISTVNFIRTKALNHREFKDF